MVRRIPFAVALLALCLTYTGESWAGIEKTGSAEYHHLCGCNNIFYLNKFEGATYDHFSVATGAGTVTPDVGDSDELPGSRTCTVISTTADSFAELTFSDTIVACRMKDRYSWLSGYYKTAQGRYATIRAQYQLNNDNVWHDMEPVVKMGVPFWSKFDYYLDFTGMSNVTDVRLRVASPDDTTAVSIDEIRICSYCDGTLTSPGPQLQSLQPSLGALDRHFSGGEASYLLTVAPSVTSIKLKPTIESQYRNDANVTISVNGNSVTSGASSDTVAIAEGTEIWIDVKKNVCERTLYVVRIHYLESPDNDATLSALGVSVGKLMPQFYQYSTQYAVVNMPVCVTSMAVTPLATNKYATITVNGTPLTNGGTSGSIDLLANPEIAIVVTAKDSVSTRTYWVRPVLNLPHVFFSSPSGYGSESVRYPSVSVSISPAPPTGDTIRVDYAATGGTATADVDDTLAPGGLTFTSTGPTTQNIPLIVVDDSVLCEGTETVEITLSNVTGGGVLGSPHMFTYGIIDNDVGSILYVRANMGTSGKPAPGNGYSWGTAYKHLQDALTAARATGSGITEIRVAAGTYYPDEGTGQSNDSRHASFALIAGVNLVGGYPADGGTSRDTNPTTTGSVLSGNVNHETDTTLNGNSYNVVSGTGCTIDGFVIRDGNADTYLSSGELTFGEGAGLRCQDGMVTVNNCLFINNSAILSGAGIYGVNCTLSAANCVFEDNTLYSTQAGYPRGAGCGLYGATGTFNGCAFLRNTGADYGAGIGTLADSVTIVGCTFDGNASNNSGGAVDVEYSGLTVLDCIFSNNAAATAGGAVYSYLGSMSVDRSSFDQNSSGGNGGAVYAFSYASSSTMENCVFVRNTAEGLGGAAAVSSLHVNNCTFAADTCGTGTGGAIHFYSGTSATVSNSVFWYNSASEDSTVSDIYCSDTNLNVSYSDIEHNNFPDNQNDSSNPLFCSYPAIPATPAQCKLGSASSPCKDSGNPQTAASVDRDNDARDSLQDRGAYEYDGTCP